MKRPVAAVVAAILALMLLSACNTQKIPAKAPQLNVAFFAAGEIKIGDIQAAQLTTSWTDAKGGGYEADAFHPLQLREYRYGEISYDFTSSDVDASVYELELQFGDKYPPQSISVQRWNAVHIGTDSAAIQDNGEPVVLVDNRFRVENDGYGYVYQVHAKWVNGNSYYAFCTNIPY